MGIAKLNVEIGARLDNLQGGLKSAERSLASFSRKMQAAGDNLTWTISAPLGAIAGLAIQAAGDYEQLSNAIKTTMTDAGRSTSEAAAEVEALRKAALAPGLDFEQAVRASIRLQNVGYNAEQARKIVTELANAITMSGGTAEDLDGVTKQFSQMISKGRILQEDLSNISERMPKIGELSRKAFGTFDPERLRAQGITAEMYVAGIVKEMEKLQRVEGGISNAVVNAGSAVKQFLGRIGEEINKAFNLTKLADEFARWMTRMGDSFAALDAPTKRTIIGFAAVVAAVGPVLKVFSMVSSSIGSLLSLGGMMVGWGKTIAGAVLNAVAAFNALNITTRSLLAAGGIIGLGLAIGGLIAYMANMRKETTAAEHAAVTLGQVQSRAAEIMASEKVEAEKLVKTLRSKTATYEEKEAALKRLQAINKTYFGELSVEKSSIDDINGSLARYIDFIGKRAKLTAANEKLVEIEGELLDVQTRMENAQPGTFSLESLKNGLLSMGNGAVYARLQTESLGKSFLDNEKALKAKKDALLQVIGQLEKEGIKTEQSASATDLFSGALKKSTVSATENAEAVKKAKDQAKAYAEVLESLAAAQEAGKVFGDTYERMADAIGNGLEKLLKEGFSATSAEVQHLLAEAEKLRGTLTGAKIPEQFLADVEKLRAAFADAVASGEIQDTGVVKQIAEDAARVAKYMQAAKDSGLALGDDKVLDAAVADAQKLSEAIQSANLPEGLALAAAAVVSQLELAIEKERMLRAQIEKGIPTISQRLELTPVVPSTVQGPNFAPSMLTPVVDTAPLADLSQAEKYAEAQDKAAASNLNFIETYNAMLAVMQEGSGFFSQTLASMNEAITASLESGGASFAALSEVVKQASEQGKSSTEQFADAVDAAMTAIGRSAVNAALKVVRSWIQQGVAAAVSKALASIPFPFNIAAGAAAGAIAGGLFNSAIAAIKIPALADGGVLTGPSVVLAGEYPGAQSNPEVIAPLDKLNAMIEPGGNTIVLGGEFVIRGKDLVWVYETAQRELLRSRGF